MFSEPEDFIRFDPPAPNTEPSLQMEQLNTSQMRMMEEVFMMSSVIAKLKAMEPSLTTFVGGAENPSGLVQRLLSMQKADSLNGEVHDEEIQNVVPSKEDIRLVFRHTTMEEKEEMQHGRSSARTFSSKSSSTLVKKEGTVKTSKRSSQTARRPCPPILDLHSNQTEEQRSSLVQNTAEVGHFNLRCWGAVVKGLVSHWVRRSPYPVKSPIRKPNVEG